jgi:hypothetical protein
VNRAVTNRICDAIRLIHNERPDLGKLLDHGVKLEMF